MTVLALLLHPITLAVTAALVTFAFMKLDCKVSTEEKRMPTYCKNMLLVSVLVGGAAYLLKIYGPRVMKGGGSVIIEDINLGEPDF